MFHFVNYPIFLSDIFKGGGRQYNSYRIVANKSRRAIIKLCMFLYRLVGSDLTVANIFISAIFIDGALESLLFP